MKQNRFSIALAIMVCSLMGAGCQSVDTHSLTLSPDGNVIASIDRVEVQLVAPGEPIRIYKGAYLRLQRIQQSKEPGFTKMQIADKGEYFSSYGGLYWSPNGRSVAFTTWHKAEPETRRLWIVGIYAKPKKTLIAENVYSFRWVDDSHMVYVTEAGDVIRATILDDGVVSEQKPLFSVGHSVDNLDGGYKYTSYLSRYEFDNPLSPHADYFVYGNSRDLTIVNISTATIAKSFPLTGMPIKFWWDDAGRNCVIGVEVSQKETYRDCVTGVMKERNTWKKTYDYYLYQREEGRLRKLFGDISDKFSGKSGESGRVWASGGKQFVLDSGYPHYKTWLFDTNSWCAVWMERKIKKIKDGDSSQLTITPLPLEYDSSLDHLFEISVSDPNYLSLEEKRNKITTANFRSRVDITPSPRGDLLAVRLSEGRQKYAVQTPTTHEINYILKITTDPTGEMALDVRKRIESGINKSFLWTDFVIDEDFLWTSDGRGLLFVAGDKLRLETIP